QFRGISGLRRELGPTQLLKECYVKTSRGTFDAVSFYFWKTTYAGLTKKGKLLLLNTMYDVCSDAFLTLDLTAPGTRINGKANLMVADVECTGERVLIK